MKVGLRHVMPNGVKIHSDSGDHFHHPEWGDCLILEYERWQEPMLVAELGQVIEKIKRGPSEDRPY